MEKTRLSAIDILSLITSFNINPSHTQPHFRLANVYSTNPTAAASSGITSTSGNNRHYLLKLGHSQKKLTIAIESGYRIHETHYKRDKEKTPNQLCLKLRKYIKGRRLDAVKQMGLDRVIYFDFGGYFLIMEFFAKGNIILTDENWKILCLLRKHEEGDEDVKYAVGETYPIELIKKYNPITRERIVESLQEAKSTLAQSLHPSTLENKQKKSSKTQNQFTLLKFLNQTLDYGPDIILHCLTKANIPENSMITEYIDNDANIDRLMDSLSEADLIVNSLMNNINQEGYIFLKKSDKDGDQLNLTPSSNGILTSDETFEISNELRERYFNCHPILFEQYKNTPYIKFESYNRAVDEYFSALDQYRVTNQKKNVEKTVNKKLDRIKKEQEDRVKSLANNESENYRHADLISNNLDLVNRAIEVIRTAVEQSMDWEEIKDIIKQQRELGDPIANIIRKFDLEKNLIGLLLSNQDSLNVSEDSDDSEESNQKSKKKNGEIVMVDITKSAYANIEEYYTRKKRANYKKEMTISVKDKTIKLAEDKAKEKLLLAQNTKADITKMRKIFWFEKFNWFITSENYLVISGRDAHQNELIVRRYLRKGDIYVHADIHGASSCIVKNSNPNIPIPQLSLNEACNYCVCRSKAWDSKLGGLSAWWVFDDQVSKTAPTGEYLSTGSFMIRGKKNYFPHCPLIMGFGIMFRVTEEDVIRHTEERKIRGSGNIEIIDSEPNSSVSTTIDDSIFSNAIQNGNNLQIIENQDNNLDDENSLSSSDNINNEQKIDNEDENEDENEESNEENNENNEESEEVSVNHIEKLIQELSSMNEAQKKKNFNNKDKKRFKDLRKKGETESSAITKTMEFKIQKLRESLEKSNEDEQKPKLTKKQKKASKTKKQRKYAAKLNEMDEEEKELLRQRLGIQKPKEEELKSDKQKLIEEKIKEEKRKKKEENRLKKFFENENIAYITEDERKSLKDIDTLTGIPHPEDTILFAVPICAPYNTLRQFKYKFKIVPGTSKRGKIAKNIYQILQKMNSTNESEMEALKRLSHDEMILSLIGNAQLSLPKDRKK